MSVEKKELINLSNEFDTPPPNVTVREHPKVGGLTIKKK